MVCSFHGRPAAESSPSTWAEGYSKGADRTFCTAPRTGCDRHEAMSGGRKEKCAV